jgi:hypothetical protein
MARGANAPAELDAYLSWMSTRRARCSACRVGFFERAFALPAPTTVTRAESAPAAVSASATARARRSESSWLYSSVCRGSACPTTRTRARPRHSPRRCSRARSSAGIVAASVLKYTGWASGRSCRGQFAGLRTGFFDATSRASPAAVFWASAPASLRSAAVDDVPPSCCAEPPPGADAAAGAAAVGGTVGADAALSARLPPVAGAPFGCEFAAA